MLTGKNFKEKGKNCCGTVLRLPEPSAAAAAKKHRKIDEKADFIGDNLRGKKKTLKFGGVKNIFLSN
ncbi:MAG: hypothetical protein MR881_05900 [Bacteroidales bacterium]|nr:hypothetical protein [Bacteroidales bacterium]